MKYKELKLLAEELLKESSGNRRAEINNLLQIIYFDNPEHIKEVTERLLYLKAHPESAGKHN